MVGVIRSSRPSAEGNILYRAAKDSCVPALVSRDPYREVSMTKIAKIILALLLLAIAGLQFIQVVTRYVLEVPLMGLQDILIYPVLWLYILGSVNASWEDAQIRANVLEIFLKSEKAKQIQLIIADLISLAIGLWLTYWAWNFLEYSFRAGRESPVLYIPTIYADLGLFVGLTLMCLFTFTNILKRAKAVSSTRIGVENA